MYYKGDIIILNNFKKAKVVEKLPNEDKWLVTYYDDNNKEQYCTADSSNIMTNDRYNVIRERHNKINHILRNINHLGQV